MGQKREAQLCSPRSLRFITYTCRMLQKRDLVTTAITHKPATQPATCCRYLQRGLRPLDLWGGGASSLRPPPPSRPTPCNSSAARGDLGRLECFSCRSDGFKVVAGLGRQSNADKTNPSYGPYVCTNSSLSSEEKKKAQIIREFAGWSIP